MLLATNNDEWYPHLDYTTLQLYNCTTLQQYNFTTVQLYNCTTVKIYNFTTLQMHNCTTLQLYSFKTFSGKYLHLHEGFNHRQ